MVTQTGANTDQRLFVFETVLVCSVFVICVSVSWKILLLDVVNLECLSEQLFGDNHPLAVTLVLLQFQTEYLGGQKIKGPDKWIPFTCSTKNEIRLQ